jgi:hypothetical protein
MGVRRPRARRNLRDEDRAEAFGSGSSKRSLKAQLPEGKESQTENLERALPKLTKAPIEPGAVLQQLSGFATLAALAWRRRKLR